MNNFIWLIWLQAQRAGGKFVPGVGRDRAHQAVVGCLPLYGIPVGLLLLVEGGQVGGQGEQRRSSEK